MGSGIIFVVIVALWAVILVPMWLRSHDAATESKSVDRFSTAMRSLSRRGGTPGSRDLLMPGRSREVEISGGRAPSAAARRARAAQLQQMRRRRTILCALGGLLVVLFLAATAGSVSWVLPMIVLAGAGGYVVNLRMQAVQAAERERRRRRSAARATVARAPRVAVPTVSSEAAPVWPVAEPRRVAEPVVSGQWEATPVVLPTYVTAPPATSVPRMIDLTHPGSWSAAHMLAAASKPNPDEIFDRVAEPVAAQPVAAQPVAAETTAQLEAEHQAVAETVPGSTAQGFLDDDVIFDQDDESTLLAFLDRRAVND